MENNIETMGGSTKKEGKNENLEENREFGKTKELSPQGQEASKIIEETRQSVESIEKINNDLQKISLIFVKFLENQNVENKNELIKRAGDIISSSDDSDISEFIDNINELKDSLNIKGDSILEEFSNLLIRKKVLLLTVKEVTAKLVENN